MGKAVKLYLGSDIEKVINETVEKRRQEKTKFLDYRLQNTF